jgi:hypothetical protein
MHESITITVSIRCTFDRAHALLSVPENFPKWASGLGAGMTRDDDAYLVQGPDGPVTVRFTPPNDFGVLDHFVTPAGAASTIHVPMRVLPNGDDGCEVMLTLFRLPGMTPEHFGRDQAWVRRDLARLKELLEAMP